MFLAGLSCMNVLCGAQCTKRDCAGNRASHVLYVRCAASHFHCRAAVHCVIPALFRAAS